MFKKHLFVCALMLIALVCSSCENKEQPIPTSDTTANTDVVTDDATTEPVLSANEIAAIIDENLDLLMSADEDFYREYDYIDANPEAFDKIVELGEAALPHLEAVSKKYYIYDIFSDGQMRCFLAMMAAYRIDPSLYDFVSTSPDGRYTAKAPVNTFTMLGYSSYGITYDDVVFIDNESGDIIITLGGYTNNINFEWSPDSKYALMFVFDSIMWVFDAAKEEYYALMHSELKNEEVTHLVKENFGEGSPLNGPQLWFSEWIDDVKVKVDAEFRIGSDTDTKFVRGWFIYDVVDRVIVEQEYEVSDTN